MLKVAKELRPRDCGSFDDGLAPILRGRVFHSTPESTFKAICESGAVLSARYSEIERQWPWATNSLFFEMGYVSFWDFFHPKIVNINEHLHKQTFYRHGAEPVTYFLMLKEEHFPKLKTWEDFTFDDWRTKQIVPHIESGLKAPVPLDWFESIFKVNL
ncbi:hypothetical protein [Pseudodesulfovibrio senegalensis]|uniref:Uncharacterized protein n=1 Tax=Pseudodesulfovibrio senegalensis TaxID=1721087 RepID=A0A6N6MXD5_9BACT|nr:hypothetical protein [Pseudodesulfovibrio senegalensis]KAB1437248.1 hypothetical protein F8A88_15510 [Pseudodesulfovibrio senegalensis]